MADTIFTHDEAAKIIEFFEDILSEHEIKIPSPEDDERDKDNSVGLYGSTYSDLLDCIEGVLIDVIGKVMEGTNVVTDEFSGKW